MDPAEVRGDLEAIVLQCVKGVEEKPDKAARFVDYCTKTFLNQNSTWDNYLKHLKNFSNDFPSRINELRERMSLPAIPFTQEMTATRATQPPPSVELLQVQPFSSIERPQSPVEKQEVPTITSPDPPLSESKAELKAGCARYLPQQRCLRLLDTHYDGGLFYDPEPTNPELTTVTSSITSSFGVYATTRQNLQQSYQRLQHELRQVKLFLNAAQEAKDETVMEAPEVTSARLEKLKSKYGPIEALRRDIAQLLARFENVRKEIVRLEHRYDLYSHCTDPHRELARQLRVRLFSNSLKVVFPENTQLDPPDEREIAKRLQKALSDRGIRGIALRVVNCTQALNSPSAVYIVWTQNQQQFNAINDAKLTLFREFGLRNGQSAPARWYRVSNDHGDGPCIDELISRLRSEFMAAESAGLVDPERLRRRDTQIDDVTSLLGTLQSRVASDQQEALEAQKITEPSVRGNDASEEEPDRVPEQGDDGQFDEGIQTSSEHNNGNPDGFDEGDADQTEEQRTTTMSTIHVLVGQFGIQAGLSCLNGLAQEMFSHEEASERDVFFRDTSEGEIRPRAVFVDTENHVLDDALHNSFPFTIGARSIIRSRGGIGAGNNWAAGFFSHGTAMLPSVVEGMRLQMEACDRVAQVVQFASLAGGTGSGLGSRISFELQDMGFSPTAVTVWPIIWGEVAVQSYNSLLSLASLSESTNGIIAIPNDSLNSVALGQFRSQRPTFTEYNQIIAQIYTSVALPVRGPLRTAPGCISSAKYPLISALSTPFRPSTDEAFSADKWQALAARVLRMASSVSPFDSELNSSLLRVPFSRALFSLHGDPNDSIRIGRRTLITPVLDAVSQACSEASLTFYRAWHRGYPIFNHEKTVGALYLGQEHSPIIRTLCSRARDKFRAGAYLHHYEKHGMDPEMLRSAILEGLDLETRYNSM